MDGGAARRKDTNRRKLKAWVKRTKRKEEERDESLNERKRKYNG